MTRLWWVLAVAATVVTVAGCGSEPPAEVSSEPAPPAEVVNGPVSGPVTDVVALCGVQGVFWQGTWWIVDPPIQRVTGESPTRRISGTMTKIGNNQARLDSPGLAAPQTLSMLPGRTANTPPFALCSPT